MNNKKIMIIGATGFVGKQLSEYIIKSKKFDALTLISRNINKKEIPYKSNIKIVQCDMSNYNSLKKILKLQNIVYVTAGLAWQHIEKNLSKTELLLEHIVQNVFGLYFIASNLRSNQGLITLSTNAIDVMLSTLSTTQKRMVEAETDALVECMLSQRIQKSNPKYLKKIAWKLVINHIMLSFVPALDYSYAYSKYLAEKTLARLSSGNIRVLRVSDIYGQRQDISSLVIDPTARARRIQRFVAAYKLISEKQIDWIPMRGKNLYGFYRHNKRITQEVWDDFVFPTYIDDVLSMMILASTLHVGNQTILEVSGKKIKNTKMIKTIKNFFKVNVSIKIKPHAFPQVKEKSKDVKKLFSKKRLRSFSQGLQEWTQKEV